jgi:hypothetical protein
MRAPTQDPAGIGAGIEALIQQIEDLDPQARVHAQELVRLLMSFYGAGLSRMLDVARTEGGGPQAVLDRFGADPLIASLLVLHDLHPQPTAVRVERALAALQPHLGHGLQLSVVSVDADSITLHIERQHTASGQAPATARIAIERAVREAAPEIGGIVIEGLPPERTDQLIQIIRRP